MSETRYPTKQREYPSKFFDSAVWNDFAFREGDIVIASYAKAGTTLTQQIVAQLLFDGAEETDVSKISPWLDAVYPDRPTRLALVESQRHRRFLKTHLPVDALVFSAKAKYIYVARDGRDIALSLYDHQSAISQQPPLSTDGGTPGRLRVVAPPPLSAVDHFNGWLDGNGHPFWPFWESVRSWWNVRSLPNVLIVHFADLICDMPREIRRIAEFLDISVDASRWPDIVRHCGFDYMKAHAARYVPQGAGLWKDGGRAFFSKGRHGRWQGVLPAEASERYKRRAVDELGGECALWLAAGNAGDTQ
ncbi:sulfotransferase domain-containing protein [Trinickia caryophylli]|uniref:Aryl sulfotransferase n=1 Tax=Trinickia caryophylli TaxID=28094 RepID=A0A1X7H4P2_TRICW|nr:sulfotransferase domain-containing protein [Trinickia caryophylli]PMS09599.1 sulfotransferase domain-containing protein [Trinickia caryophylli]TRX17267.1 sulfotransferase domain-containing protein [Trinickia caryophylli]WQE11995.1 sulfotransferase domain-containing protein [Trinickia caryophylli]SMF79711.1 aryl sulfotransferase [Trinickia caryophylli]GLU35612.1 sulfotransferase [Trinickia caryophylli]